MSFIYIIVLLILIIACLNYKDRRLAYFCMLFMVILGAMRGTEVGTDTLGYSFDYDSIIQLRDGDYIIHKFEKGYVTLIYLFKKYVTHEYLPFVSLMFTIFFIGVIRLLQWTKTPYSLGLFFLFTLGFYFSAYNTMRQMMAVCIIFLFVNWLYETKYYLFASVVVITSILFHNSSLIMLLLIPIHYYSLKAKEINKAWIYSAIVSSFLIFFVSKTYLQAFLLPIADLLYARAVGYINGEMGNMELGYAYMGAQSVFAMFVIYFYNGNRKYRFEYYAYIVGIVIFNLMSSLSVVGTRLATPFMIFSVILFPKMILDKTIKKDDRMLFIIGVLIVSLFLFYFRYGYKNYGQVNPYKWEWRKF